MRDHVVVPEFASTHRQCFFELPHRLRTSTLRLILCCRSLAAVMLLAGCASETLFQSNFDAIPVGQPPSHVQKIGTANVDGPPGSVVVVAPPVAPSGKWVQISRPSGGRFVAGMQGVFSQFRGSGVYTFSTFLFIPSSSSSNIATIQFEPLNQPSSFLHLDFMQDNSVRIDDATKFGAFPRDQIFILQVTLNINASSPTAHIVLSGAGALGQADYNIIPLFRPMAQKFGAIRIWMGFPWTGAFDATNIVVTRNTQ